MKCIFFDVDGTLCPFGSDMPDETHQSLLSAKANGHRLFLCTGRTRAELPPRIAAFPFDGGVYASGAITMIGDERISKRFFSLKQIADIFTFSHTHDLSLFMQCEDGTYMTSAVRTEFEGLFKQYIGRSLIIENLRIVPMLSLMPNCTKILFASHRKSVAEVRALLSSRFDTVDNAMGLPAELSGELVQKGLNKTSGISAIAKALSLDKDDICAIGDGANDVEMFAFARYAIAMGNATLDLKEKASFVTGNADSGGIVEALRYLEVV